MLKKVYAFILLHYSGNRCVMRHRKHVYCFQNVWLRLIFVCYFIGTFVLCCLAWFFFSPRHILSLTALIITCKQLMSKLVFDRSKVSRDSQAVKITDLLYLKTISGLIFKQHILLLQATKTKMCPFFSRVKLK